MKKNEQVSMSEKNSRIHILDTHTANCIAAGEVAERPMSVVKELVENALDAGARHIEVRIYDQACSKLHVLDDGCGMSPEDMRLALQRHATSKLRQVEDLNSLTTLGFRGEALPSIAAISLMTITSKTAEAEVGYTMTVEGGKAGVPEETGCRDGTKIVVDRLYYNTPARRKFLKTATTELRLITDYMAAMALAHLDCAITLKNGNSRIISTRGNGDMVAGLLETYGRTALGDLLALPEVEQEGFSLSGLISMPSRGRSSRNHYHFFINGRAVRCPELYSALEDGYYTLLPRDRYPMAFIFLQLPPDSIDVNVHPAKLEVKLRNPVPLAAALVEAVRYTMRCGKRLEPLRKPPRVSPSDVVLPMPLQPLPKGRKPSSSQAQESAPVSYLELLRKLSDDQAALSKQLDLLDDGELPPTSDPEPWRDPVRQPEPLLPVELPEDYDQPQTKLKGPTLLPRKPKPLPPEQLELKLKIQPMPPGPIPGQPLILDEKKCRRVELTTEQILSGPRPAHVLPLQIPYSSLTVLAQHLGTYIICAAGRDLVIIDQHAAAERIEYEAIVAQTKEKPADSAQLLIPYNISFSHADHLLIVEHIIELRDFGFILEYYGGSTYILRGIPAWYEEAEADALLYAVLDQLRAGEPNGVKLRREELFMAACKRAVKANHHLTPQEIDGLFAKLDQCQDRDTCPHGRPIAIALSEFEMRRRFMRGAGIK